MTDTITNGWQHAAARFKLGAMVATRGALRVLSELGIEPMSLLLRHVTGDFGDLDAEDIRANEQAIADGLRVLSAYSLRSDHSAEVHRLYVITEWDRSVTTVLLAQEY